MDNTENKGLWTRISSWVKTLFKREAPPRKRGTLRKKSTPVLARAKALVQRTGRTVAACGRMVGYGAWRLLRCTWPVVARLLHRTAEFFEPLLHVVAIMAMAVAGSILAANVAVYIAGFVGEAMAATLTFIAAYLGMHYLSAAVKALGDPDDSFSASQLGGGEPEPTIEELGDVLAALTTAPEHS